MHLDPQQEDARDPLGHLRSQFVLPTHPHTGQPLIYFCGHSLGPQPLATAHLAEEFLDDWGRLAVEGHTQGTPPWVSYHETVAPGLARLVGAAEPTEVVAMNTLTVNLHLLCTSFYRPTAQRYKILTETRPFSSDTYALQSQARLHGYDPAQALVHLQPRPGEATLRTDDILDAIDRQGHEVALLLLGGVSYVTGQLFDLAAIAAAARRKGMVVGYDLAHAFGNVPLHLHDWDVDFAVWCHYKYGNSGPGAVAGAFVHARHAAFSGPRLAGWWGQRKDIRFQMGPDFEPIAGAEGWQLSNPPILGLLPLRASLALFDAAGIDTLRAKSLRLTGYFAHLLGQIPGLTIQTPADPAQRGAMLCLEIAHGGRALFDRLRNEHSIVGDWREPNVIRLTPAPLYNTFAEVHTVAQALASLLSEA